MDTGYVWVVAVSIAVGGLMWQMGGFSSVVAPGPADQLDSAERFNKTAQNSSLNKSFEGDARSSDGSLVGLTLSAISAVFDLVGFVVMLPSEFRDLGLPRWAAWPLGLLGWTIMTIGLIQFISGREL